MKAIINHLPSINKRILTSATQGVKVPGFVRLDKPKVINYLKEKTNSQLAIKIVIAPDKSKFATLLTLLEHIEEHPGIIFCNLRDSISQVSSFLERKNISHTCFSGGMEQKDRERALIKFRNGNFSSITCNRFSSKRN